MVELWLGWGFDNYDVLNVFLDVHLYLRLKNHIDVFLDVLNIVLDVVLGIDIEMRP